MKTGSSKKLCHPNEGGVTQDYKDEDEDSDEGGILYFIDQLNELKS